MLDCALGFFPCYFLFGCNQLKRRDKLKHSFLFCLVLPRVYLVIFAFTSLPRPVWWETGGQFDVFHSKRDGAYRNIDNIRTLPPSVLLLTSSRCVNCTSGLSHHLSSRQDQRVWRTKETGYTRGKDMDHVGASDSDQK